MVRTILQPIGNKVFHDESIGHGLLYQIASELIRIKPWSIQHEIYISNLVEGTGSIADTLYVYNRFNTACS